MSTCSGQSVLLLLLLLLLLMVYGHADISVHL